MKRTLIYNSLFNILLISLLSLSLEQTKIPTSCSYSCTGKAFYYDKEDSDDKKVTISITSYDMSFVCTQINYGYSNYLSQYTSLGQTTIPDKIIGLNYVKYTFTGSFSQRYLIFKVYAEYDTSFDLSVDYVESNSSSSNTTNWIIGVVVVCIILGGISSCITYCRRKRAAIIIY